MTAGSASASWADALMMREDLFDRLVDLDGTAARFQRVLLAEDIAPRLSLGDVAAMLGIEAGGLVRLADGDDPARLDDAEGAELPAEGPPPADTAPPDRVVDTRPIFDSGHEPLPAILDAAEQVPAGGTLLVLAPFHPLPLRRLLRRRGFASTAWPDADVCWHVAFRREDANARRESGALPERPI